MSYGIKKLADVELLNSTPKNANKLIEVDGEVKRVPDSESEIYDTIVEDVAKLSEEIANVSWDTLKDKPFGEEVNRTEVLAPFTFTMDENENKYGDTAYRDYFDYSGSPIKEFLTNYVAGDENFGREYVVVYDGVEYVCRVHDSDGPGLGNGELFDMSGYGEDVPFLLQCYFSARDIFTTEPGEHTIAVYTQTTEIKTLDLKFLPEGTPMSYLVLQSTTPGSTKKFKLTVDDSGEPTFEEITE